MTEQLALFGAPGEAMPPAAARRDPETSHIAARNLEATGKRQTRAELAGERVRRYPGLTCRELARHLRLADHHDLQKGLSDGVKRGVVAEGSVRACKITGNPCTTWWPA